MRGWRPALLIAWRDALRHRGRSALVLVMISLPVLGVSAAAVVITTAEVSGIEGADRAMGAADARVRTEGRGPVVQAPDPDRVGWSPLGEVDIDDPLTEDDLRAVLGHDARLVPITEGSAATRLDDRVFDFSTTGVDLSDPIAEGLFELEAGRLPEADGEVVVNGPMLDKGLAVGDELEIAGTELRIVGAGRDASAYDRPVVLGSAQDLPSGSTHVREWLVDAGPVSWAQVRELNAVGGVVTSRAVLADPPDVATMAEHLGHDTGQDETYAVVALIVVMALIEVVLLAGPAFAVGARRHARTLALIAASGGTPAQARRVILGSGVVLGLVASGVGLVLGVLAGWALLPLVQRFSGDWFGPFEAPWPYLAATTAFGLVSAVLASVVPAWLASRQDVVAVLAGRRGDRRPRTSTPVVGLALLGAGVAASAYGAVTSDSGNGAFWIAGAAVVSVLGMILVVPVVVATVARLAGRLPLTARYAVRDAERHRTRTVPAVAAVAATVAGVVALGIANASDERQNEATYWPQAPMGTGLVSWGPNVLPGEETPDPEPVWRSIEQVVREAAPEAVLQRTHSLAETYDAAGWTSSHVRLPSEIEDGEGWGLTVHGPSVAVSDTAAGAGVVGDVGAEVDEALAAGRTVVFTRDTAGEVEAELVQERWQDGSEQAVDSEAHRLDAVMLPWDEATQGPAPASTILPTAVTTNLGLEVEIRDLRFAGDIDEATQTRITEAVGGVVDGTYTYVERGYVRPDEATVVLLVLGGLGGLLMLGGTLTATFLALSDARPDLATLSAVGAAPRTRRRVAAAYAIVVGLVGSVLGAVVGFIPGVAISRPLTAVQTGPTGESGPYLAIPWLLIAVIVIALPLLTAVVVGLTARSRLPLVARLD